MGRARRSAVAALAALTGALALGTPIANAQRAPTRIGSGAARRIVIVPQGVYVLQEDGVLMAWARDLERVPSHRFMSGPVPGAMGLVDFCGGPGVLGTGALGELSSAGRFVTGGASSDARRCGYRLGAHTLCTIDTRGYVHCRYAYGAPRRPVRGVHGAVRVTVENEVCALARGAVTCWSEGSPLRVILSGVVTFDVSRRNGCAIREGGELVCWAGAGQRRPFDESFRRARERCRVATTEEELERECQAMRPGSGEQAPAEVGIHDAVDVTVEANTGVVILRDGRVLAWGMHTGFWSNNDAVREVPWLRAARHVEIGNREVCAILADGHAACWPQSP